VACACALAQCDGLTNSDGRSCSVGSGPHNFFGGDVVARLYLAGALRDAWRGGWSFHTSSASPAKLSIMSGTARSEKRSDIKMRSFGH